MTPTPAAPTTGSGPDEWIYRDDAAKLCRCSTDTIDRIAKRNTWQTRLGDRGRVMVRLADLVATGRVSTADLALFGSGAGAAAAARNQEQVTALRVEVAGISGRLAERDLVLDELRAQALMYREQLKVKDRQILKLEATCDRIFAQQAYAPRPAAVEGSL